MKVTVIGSGYVGLVAGTCFAECGNSIICADLDEAKVVQLNKGIPTIYEPGLEHLLKRNIAEDRLVFTTDIKYAIETSEIIFIAVGTPEGVDGFADLKYVLAVASDIGKYMNEPKVVVNKSTVPVGTADLVRESIKKELMQRSSDHDVQVISNPEFLKEGTAIDDFTMPERVVIGGQSEDAITKINELYSPFLRTGNRIYNMDNRSAELTKYAANSMLATKISFINEIANLCEKVGADIDMVRVGIGTDSRIGPKFLFPGIGYGGSCFPKDVKALIKTGAKYGVDLQILRSVEATNKSQKIRLFQKIEGYYQLKDEDLNGKRFGVWGLSFKAKTDDVREAPATVVIDHLLSAGAEVVAYDPEAMSNAKAIFGNKVEFVENMYDVINNMDALIIHTEWNEFRNPDFDRLKAGLTRPIIFDGRNLYKKTMMESKGFEYFSIGR
jgi:UDPglucose 6-dehydrogenase